MFGKAKNEGESSGLKIHLIGLAAIAGLSLAGYVVGLKPALASGKAQDAQQAMLLARKQEASSALKSLTVLQRQIDDLRETLGRQPLNLLPAQQSNQRVAELARLTDERGLVVEEVLSSQSRPTTRFELVPIHVSGRGSFLECAKFLRDLHATYIDINASTIELTDNPDDLDSELSFRFDLMWYAAPTVPPAAQ